MRVALVTCQTPPPSSVAGTVEEGGAELDPLLPPIPGEGSKDEHDESSSEIREQ